MKNKRVGTISMAIVLIGFGILIFIAQINKLSAVELAIKFWPGILILLGIEVLIYSYAGKKEQNIVIKYDIISILIVMLILAVNLGIYGLMEFGIMERIKTEISSQTFNYELPLEEYVVEENIEKIIIDGPRYSDFTIRTNKTNKVNASGFINVTSDSEENAKKVLDESFINIKKCGNIMYLSFKDKVNYNYNICDMNIIIPDDKEVEICGGNDLEFIVDSISKNVLIDNVRGLQMRVKKDLDVKIKANGYHEDEFSGNAKWKTTQTLEKDSTKVIGELIYGDGTNIISIINSNDVAVDEI